MTRLPFVKLSGAGNDFVLIDGSLLKLPGARLAKKLCSRRTGVGADGLLIVSRKGKRTAPSVDYYNADGTKAFCGNGTRCAAWWAHLKGWTGRNFFLRTISGPIAAQIMGPERVRLAMPQPQDVRWNLRLAAEGRIWLAHFIKVGVPHLVVETERLESVTVAQTGRALRHHKALAPEGANIDFMAKPTTSRKHIPIRTYERGVEDETLACGSGSVASAFCAHFLYGAPSPIRIAARGGDTLTVYFKTEQGRLSEAWLEGPAKITFSGEVTL